MTLLAQSTISKGFDDNVQKAVTFLPKLGAFLLILIVGYFVAKIVAKIITTVLQKVGFDRVVERGGIKKALSQSKYDAAGLLGKIVFYFIFLGVLSLAFGVFGSNNPVSQFLAQIIGYLPRLFVAVLALVLAFAIAAAVKDLLENSLGGLAYGKAVANGASLFIIAIGVFFALNQLNIASLIVGGIFYALLALIVIPPIIAFGVGGIEPARQAITNLQSKAQDRSMEIKAEAASPSSSSQNQDPPIVPARRIRPAGAPTTRRARPQP